MAYANLDYAKAFQDMRVTSSEIAIRRIGVNDLRLALKKGYADFNARPSFGAFLFIVYPLFALLLTVFLVGENLRYLAFPIVAGFTLLGPVVCVGLMERSRRRELGLDLSWRSAFGFVHSASFAPILALSLLMMVLYVAWLFMAQFIYVGLFGAEAPASLAELAGRLTSTREGVALALYGSVVGLIFAFAALALSVVAFPLLLHRPSTAVTAIGASIRAVTANLSVMALWGVIVVALLTAGAALFLIGLAAVLPILGHATWHLYRALVDV